MLPEIISRFCWQHWKAKSKQQQVNDKIMQHISNIFQEEALKVGIVIFKTLSSGHWIVSMPGPIAGGIIYLAYRQHKCCSMN